VAGAKDRSAIQYQYIVIYQSLEQTVAYRKFIAFVELQNRDEKYNNQ